MPQRKSPPGRLRLRPAAGLGRANSVSRGETSDGLENLAPSPELYVSYESAQKMKASGQNLTVLDLTEQAISIRDS